MSQRLLKFVRSIERKMVGRRDWIAIQEQNINQFIEGLKMPDPEEPDEDPELRAAMVRIALANVARKQLRDHVRMGEWLHPPLPEYDDQEVPVKESPNG
jgi:hypothetical protein